MLAVVVLSAVICSSTSFWLVIAWATVTAVRSADDGGGRGAVDALHQLDIVLLDQVEREIALHRHRHLGQQVGGALAGVEQRASRGSPWPWPARSRRARWPCPRAACRALLEMWIICSSLCIVFHRPARSVSIAALSISSSSLPLARRGEDRGDVGLRAAILVEIMVDALAERDDPEELAAGQRLAVLLGIERPRPCGEARSGRRRCRCRCRSP